MTNTITFTALPGVSFNSIEAVREFADHALSIESAIRAYKIDDDLQGLCDALEDQGCDTIEIVEMVQALPGRAKRRYVVQGVEVRGDS
jgi:hypothetical protein